MITTEHTPVTLESIEQIVTKTIEQSVGKNVQSIEKNVKNIENNIHTIEKSIQNIEKRIEEFPTRNEVKEMIKEGTKDLVTKTDLADAFDELARMTAVGFKGVDARFAELENNLADFKAEMYEFKSYTYVRFGEMYNNLVRIDGRLDGMNSNLVHIDGRLSKIERRFDKVKTPLLQLAHEIQ